MLIQTVLGSITISKEVVSAVDKLTGLSIGRVNIAEEKCIV